MTSRSCGRSTSTCLGGSTNAHISPTGARALFEARGEILTVPAEKGDTRNLTETTGVIERDPAWSPDGKWIAYFSDESGEYELHLRDSRGVETGQEDPARRQAQFLLQARLVAGQQEDRIPRRTSRTPGTWTSRRKKPVKVDKDRYLFGPGAADAAWSPDSKWLAYTKRLKNYMSAVFVYSLADGKSTPAHRRDERRAVPGLRQGRQAPLLHGQH